jgi:hypothetical protein
LPLVFRLQTRSDAIWELKRLDKDSAEQRILEILEVADAAISQAQSLEAARQLCGVAEIVRTCTSELDMAQQIQNDAVAFAVRSEFHASQLLKAATERGELSTGTRGQLHGRTPTGDPNIAKKSAVSGEYLSAPPENSSTLAKHFARRIRRWENLSPEVLETRIEEKRREGKLTKSAVLGGDNAAPKGHKPAHRQTAGAGEKSAEELGETNEQESLEQEPLREPAGGPESMRESLPLQEVHESEILVPSPYQSRYGTLLQTLRDLRDHPLDGAAAAELAAREDLGTLQAVRSFFQAFYARLRERFPLEPQQV